MGFIANMKGQRAYILQSKGKPEEARKLYEEAVAGGLSDARCLLAYAVLLIRSGEYQKARELLVKTQKTPGITPEQKTQLFMNYAVCVYKMGDIDKGIHLLESQHKHQPAGLIYQTLGYLYVEKYKLENKPAPEPAAPAEEPSAEEPTSEAPTSEAQPEAEEPAAAPTLTPLEAYEQGVEKGLAFCQEAVAYDDEDPVCMDNIGQFYYRVLGDKEAAREWFDKAHELKPGQIDTLWFLSRYDLEKGDRAAALEKLEKCMEGRFSPLNYADKDRISQEIQRLKAQN